MLHHSMSQRLFVFSIGLSVRPALGSLFNVFHKTLFCYLFKSRELAVEKVKVLRFAVVVDDDVRLEPVAGS